MGAQWYKWANCLVQNIFESTEIWHISTDAINDIVQPLHYNRMKLSACYLIHDLMMMMTRFLSFSFQNCQLKKVSCFGGRLSFSFISSDYLATFWPLYHVYIIFSLTGKSLWELVLEQFEDLLVRILLLAACISFVSKCIYEDNTYNCLLQCSKNTGGPFQKALRINGNSGKGGRAQSTLKNKPIWHEINDKLNVSPTKSQFPVHFLVEKVKCHCCFW